MKRLSCVITFYLCVLVLMHLFSCAKIEIPEDDSNLEIKDTTSIDLKDLISVSECLNKPSGTNVSVVGYVVGYISNSSSLSGAKFDCATFENTNFLLADKREEQDVSNCLPIALTAGSQWRKLFNMKSSPEIYGARVIVTGEITRYFGQNGIRTIKSMKKLDVSNDKIKNSLKIPVSKSRVLIRGGR